MITHHGYKRVAVDRVLAPGGIERIRKESHTISLGASFEATGNLPADPIICEYATGKLLGGRHRFAAALNEGLKTVWALLLEGTPEELEQACLVEQIRRRKPTDAEIARLLELEHPTPEQTFPDVDDEDEDEEEAKPKRGSRLAAIKRVAEMTGRTPAAVKQAAHRAGIEDDGYSTEALARCLNWLGLPVDEEVETLAYSEHVFLEGIEKTLVKLQGDWTRHGGSYPQLKIALHLAATESRRVSPHSVCPHCKLIHSLRPGCLACRGLGYLTMAQMAAIPTALLATGADAGVFVEGKFTLLKDVKP
jgi:hypothetical protein